MNRKSFNDFGVDDVHEYSNSTRDEEKQRRATKRLSEKMRHAEEKLRSEEERRAKYPEKYERKNAERLERAKKRCEQIRQIIGAIDPANLNSTSPCHAATSTSNTQTTAPRQTSSVDDSLSILNPSAETIRLLSTAIAGCLQPCNLINKILNEIIGMVPQPLSETAAQTTTQASSDQQQQTEFPRQNSATNTSDLNTPAVGTHPSSQEIEALFKEAAKELEKMNEIVASGKTTEASTSASRDPWTFSTLERSHSSSTSAITQIERNVMAESTLSNATLINVEDGDATDGVEARNSPLDFKIVTPPKSMRSRDSSIEVHDVNSMMSDDSRDWTMLDAAGNEQEESNFSIDDEDKSANVEPTEKSPEYLALINSVSTDTQTLASLLSNSGASSAMSHDEVRTSIQKSIQSVGEMSDMVKSSIASAQQSLQSIPQASVTNPVLVLRPGQAPQSPKVEQPEAEAPRAPIVPQMPPANPMLVLIPNDEEFLQAPQASAPVAGARVPFLSTLSATTQANLAATRLSSAGAKPKLAKSPIVVYDPNPKINAAVHQMIFMGFTNEGAQSFDQ